jgi:peptidoglycan/LPS O-acetylase OafA/YrhL
MNEPKRRHDVDWLRVLAVLMLIPFHTARIFDFWEPFYAKSDQVSAALTYVFIGAVNPWHMPLFFLLAGAATWFALGSRSGGQYVKERLRRLIVPLLSGLLVIVPPQSYVGALTYGQFEGSLLQYYPRFFQIGATGDLSGYMGGFTPGHLWFILFLFLISMMALPLLLYLRQERGLRLIDLLAGGLHHRPARLWWLVLPLIVAGALPDIGGKNPFYFFVLFVYGYVLMADARFRDVLDRVKVVALVMGLVLLVGLLTILAVDAALPGWAWKVLGALYDGPLVWSLLIAMLGFGRRTLSFGHPILKYASEAAYPVYILHQTVIVIVGYYVVRWPIGIWPQFLAIGAAAAVLTVLVYEMLIRRANVVRFLFGMRPKRRNDGRESQPVVMQET